MNENNSLKDNKKDKNYNEDYDPDIVLKEYKAMGKMNINEAKDILYEIGDTVSAKLLENQLEVLQERESVEGLSQISLKLSDCRFFKHTYRSTNYEVGYIEPIKEKRISLSNAQLIEPENLINEKLNISLERIYTEDFSGIRKNHDVLFHFYIKTINNSVNFVKFLKLRVKDFASIKNKPVFNSVLIGDDGLNLKLKVININNNHDGEFLRFLKSKGVDVALNIIAGATPIISIVSHIALGITKATLKSSSKNHIVQDINCTFTFNQSPLGIKLKEGSYIFMQIPKEDLKDWKWDDWEYNGIQIVKKNDSNLTPKYNYIIIGIYK